MRYIGEYASLRTCVTVGIANAAKVQSRNGRDAALTIVVRTPEGLLVKLPPFSLPVYHTETYGDPLPVQMLTFSSMVS